MSKDIEALKMERQRAMNEWCRLGGILADRTPEYHEARSRMLDLDDALREAANPRPDKFAALKYL